MPSAMTDRTLEFVLYCFRPLTLKELIVAVSFPSTADSFALPVLLDICGRRLVVDNGLGIVQFAHFSVQEFVLNVIPAEEAHGMITDVELRFLLVSCPDFSLGTVSSYAT